MKLRTWFALLMVSLLGVAAGQTLIFTGDINLGRRSAGDWHDIFTPVRSVLWGDAVIGNLESPLTDKPYQGQSFDLRALSTAVAALHPFTHLSVENNHALDGGEAGQYQSRAELLAHGLQPVGSQPLIVKIANRKLAFLSYLDGPAGAPVGLVRAARERADMVIVLPHWGAEYDGVTQRQRQQARALAAAGATLIVGSGPHVLQGSERMGNTLVMYSLGNFLFDQPYPATWPGGAARVTWTGQQWAACLQATFSKGGQVRLASPAEAQQAAARTGLPLCGFWK